MKRQYLGMVVGLALALSPQPLLSQRVKSTELPLKTAKNAPGAEQARASHELRKSSPALFLQKSVPARPAALYKEKPFSVRRKLHSSVSSVNPSLVLWGDVVSPTLPGFHSFSPVNPIAVTRLNDYSQAFFNAGCGRVGNKLCGVYLDLTWQEYGFIQSYYFTVDTDTWQVADAPTPLPDFSLSAVETAQDANTGEVFGEFRNADGSGLEWGVVDYATKTRTTIAQAANAYVALGIAQDGYAYGVAQDGNLYRIDRKTGGETKIGSTGVAVVADGGSSYFQSGEIDPKTNTFYWAATDAAGASALYTVDLSTGLATKVGDYPNEYGGANITGLTIPKAAAEDGAPAAITDLKALFVGGALTGKITFTAPSTTFDGKGTLSGQLGYRVVVNGLDTLKGTTVAGEPTTVDVTTHEGTNQFVAFTFNSEGNSPSAKTTAFVGTDTPAAPANVRFEADSQGASRLSWNAAKGQNGGWLGSVRYDVARISGKDTLWVRRNLADTTFTEQIPQAKLKAYRYGVAAKNDNGGSALALSNEQLLGDAFDVPYFNDFDSNLDLYTVIDANNDGATWSWDAPTKSAAYHWSTSAVGDDWLITPPIHLMGGKSYKVSFKARSTNGSLYPERLEALWGKGNSPELLTDTLLGTTVLDQVSYQQFAKTIRPKTEGKYYMGFHAVSDASMYYLYVDSILVEEAPDANAPDSVTSLKAVCDPTGELLATLSFNAPTKTLGGAALGSLSRIEVRKGNDLVATIEKPSPGAALTATDSHASQGTNTYSVYAYNAAGSGPRSSVSVFVGVDMPDMPVVTARDNTHSVTLSWDSVEGLNGGIIQPAKTRYDIFNVSDGYVSDSLTSVTGETEYEVTGMNNDEGEPQSYRTWAVRAVNGAGESSYGVAAIVVGKPYALPFHQSFKNATDEGLFMGINHGEGNYQWQITGEASADGDGGSQAFSANEASQGDVYTGKITLKGAKNPHLLFYYRAAQNLPVTLAASFEQKDGRLTKVFSCDLSQNTNDEWTRVVVKLPASLATEDYVKLHFTGTAMQGLAGKKIFVDNINIVDPPKADAAITLNAPARIKKGQTLTVDMTLKNNGLDELVGPRVRVAVNGESIADSTLDLRLGLLESAVIPVRLTTSRLDEGDKLAVSVEVVAEGDLLPDNNMAALNVATEEAQVNAPTDLRFTDRQAGSVTLAWTEPEVDFLSLTDDFESYDPWSLTFGDWTTIDADGGLAQALSSMATYPHQGEAFAFMDWQPSDLFRSGAGLDPYSGTKALVGICQLNESRTAYVDADNWLISPRLSGRAQTLSFWVNNFPQQGYGTESFQVWTSTTDNEKGSFQMLGVDYTQGSGEWTRIEVSLPEGTTYFAIRQNTPASQAFLFMLDDITFEVASQAASYRVYREGSLVGATSATTYQDQGLEEGDYQYAVTAVYPDGSESAPALLTVSTQIPQTEMAKVPAYDVYSVTGAMVRRNASRLSGLPKGVYIVGGRKVVVK